MYIALCIYTERGIESKEGQAVHFCCKSEGVQKQACGRRLLLQRILNMIRSA